MDSNEESKLQSEYVIWRHIDILMAVFAFSSGMYFWGYSHYKPIGMLSVPLVIILLCCGKLYLRERKNPLWFRIGSGIARALCYIAVITGLVFCLMSTWDIKAVYPIQRKMFLSNFTAEDIDAFLPEELPEKSDNYFFNMGCAPKGSISSIGMSFFTDPATYSEFKARAEKLGLSPDNEPAADYNKNWDHALKSAGVDPEKAEFYYAPDSSESYPKAYIFEESSGFVKLYY